MNSGKPAKVPPAAWLAAIGFVVIFTFISDLIYHNSRPLESLGVERLERMEENGVVVIGNSLVKTGLPFDEGLDSMAEEKGMEIEFVRFSINTLSPQIFKTLMDEILAHRPRFVFLQAEPFFLDKKIGSLGIMGRVAGIRRKTHLLVIGLLYKTKSIFTKSDGADGANDKNYLRFQGDFRKELQKVATMAGVRKNTITYKLKPPAFPEFIEAFIKEARLKDIRVILLEVNRSKAGNEILGTEFRSGLNETLGSHPSTTAYRFGISGETCL